MVFDDVVVNGFLAVGGLGLMIVVVVEGIVFVLNVVLLFEVLEAFMVVIEVVDGFFVVVIVFIGGVVVIENLVVVMVVIEEED